MSDIHSSFNFSLSLGRTLTTSVSLKSTLILEPTASEISIVSVERSSQGLAINVYGLDVNAPTGHRSTTLPDSSDWKILPTYVPISVSRPLFVVPKFSTPAISIANLTQRVQCIQRVMIVFIKGPQFLSSTPLLYSKNRLLSLPKNMA